MDIVCSDGVTLRLPSADMLRRLWPAFAPRQLPLTLHMPVPSTLIQHAIDIDTSLQQLPPQYQKILESESLDVSLVTLSSHIMPAWMSLSYADQLALYKLACAGGNRTVCNLFVLQLARLAHAYRVGADWQIFRDMYAGVTGGQELTREVLDNAVADVGRMWPDLAHAPQGNIAA